VRHALRPLERAPQAVGVAMLEEAEVRALGLEV
jgi:hypothetical protein